MFELFRLRAEHGRQYLRDVTEAEVNPRYRGFPLLDEAACTHCGRCVELCPTAAIRLEPLRLDLGACVFCGRCEDACPAGAITFTSFHKTAAAERAHLVVEAGTTPEAYAQDSVPPRPDLKRLFGRSLKLRSVSAGGCNACEMELSASTNVNFDIGRFGVDIVASPRHADGIVITGPVTKSMAFALEQTLQATPEPRIVVAFGACAISGAQFARSPEIDRAFFDRHPVDLYVPGSPPHPLTFVNGILALVRGLDRARIPPHSGRPVRDDRSDGVSSSTAGR